MAPATLTRRNGSRDRRRLLLSRITAPLALATLLASGFVLPAGAEGAPSPDPTSVVDPGPEGAAARSEQTGEPTAGSEDPAPAAPESPGTPSPTETPPTETPTEAPTSGESPATVPAAPATEGPQVLGPPVPEQLPDAGEAPDVTPFVVPPPTATTSVITVRTGGDQASEVAVAPLPGVTLQLYTGGTAGPENPVTDAWATCVADADGDCSFIVPNTQLGGANRDQRFWIVQTGAPTGWYLNTLLGTGSSGQNLTYYSFQTGTRLRAGTTYTSGTDFMIGTGGTTARASGGIWQTSRNNPPRPNQCGIDVALVLDLSGSIEGNLDDLKTVTTNFVDSLTGTPSGVGLYTFSSNAPAAGNPNLDLTPVSTAAGAQTVKDRIETYSAGGGTNWDEGIYQVATSLDDYELAIVLTDGNPTFYGDAQGPGNYTRFREVENGIFSANAVKAQGTRIVAFGVGAGIDDAGSGFNLESISGQERNSDFFQTTNFEEVGQRLRALALTGCEGSISMVKEVVPSTAPEGSIEGAEPAGGWEFTAAPQSGDITVNDPATVTTEVETGSAGFQLTAPTEQSTGTIGIAETVQEGFTLQQVGGANAVCRDIVSGETVEVTNDGAAGFVVPVSAASAISCTVYNRAPNPVASLTVDKEWEINGTVYPEGEQPAGLQSALTIAGTPQPWGVPRTGLQEGQTPEIAEADVVTLTQCSLVEADLVEFNGESITQELPYSPTLVAGANTATVRNVLECTSVLTLAKTVSNGSAEPGEWTLDALAPEGALVGPSGPAGSETATAEVTPDAVYPLAESDGDPNYVQFTDPQASLIDGSTGSWFCVELAADGETVIPGFADGLNGAVRVPLGLWVRCTAVNQTSTLDLRKVVENSYGGTAVPADWSITATPTGTVPAGVEPQTVTGSTAGTTINVRPGVTYQVTEAGTPVGYVQESAECVDEVGGAFEGTTGTLPVLDSATCTFTNVDTPARITLVKQVEAGATRAEEEPVDWTLTAAPDEIAGQDPVVGNGDPTTAGGVFERAVLPGEYDLSESFIAGFTADDWTCTGATVDDATVTVPFAGDVTCTVINRAQQPTLTLVKEVDNGSTGATAEPADWTLAAAGPTPVSGASGTEAVTSVPVAIGQYVLSETGPPGYTPGTWTCGGVPLVDSTLTIALGVGITCTITNTAQQPTLTLVKEVDNGASGGTAVPADWTLTADGPTPVSGGSGSPEVTGVAVEVGDYDLSEDGPEGYDAGDWVCVGGALAGSTVTVELGGAVTCTITNTAQQPTLTLVKEVDNGASGGTAVPADWTLTAAGPTPVSGGSGSPEVTGVAVEVGDYDLSEAGPEGYDAGEWVCVGGTLEDSTVTVELGGAVTCTITNTAQQPTLTLVKEVDNGSTGSTAVPADWTLTATGPTPVSGASGSEAVTGADVAVGSYELSEAGPEGYDASEWVCEGGVQSGSTLTVALGDTVTCTITNTAQQPTLTLIKEVVNDDGGTAVPTDWTLTADGPTTVSGATGSPDVTGVAVEVGDYDLSEDGPAGYEASEWVCVGGTLAGSTLTVALGDAVTCTIINEDAQAPFTVVKSSDPENGATVLPGDVITYTVTATRVGEGFDSEVVVTDDLAAVLNNATFVEGSIEASTGSAVLTGTTLTWELGELLDTETITYQVRVNDGAYGVTLTNVVTSPGAEPCVEPDGPAEAAPTDDTLAGEAPADEALAAAAVLPAVVDPAEACRTTSHVTPAWTLTKSSDPASGTKVAPGSTITYTLTATSTTDALVTGAVVTDDLSKVLAYGSLVATPEGATLSGSTLTWAVPDLTAAGQTATLTYQVRLASNVQGVTVTNLAAPGPGGGCVVCTTTHSVPTIPAPPGSGPGAVSTGGLAFTGADAATLVAGAALLVLLGAVLVRVRRRTLG